MAAVLACMVHAIGRRPGIVLGSQLLGWGQASQRAAGRTAQCWVMRRALSTSCCRVCLTASCIGRAHPPHLPTCLLLCAGPAVDADGRYFNRRWGYLSRAGVNDKSQLMRQMEKYADIYTSRVSNFLRYTVSSVVNSRQGPYSSGLSTSLLLLAFGCPWACAVPQNSTVLSPSPPCPSPACSRLSTSGRPRSHWRTTAPPLTRLSPHRSLRAIQPTAMTAATAASCCSHMAMATATARACVAASSTSSRPCRAHSCSCAASGQARCESVTAGSRAAWPVPTSARLNSTDALVPLPPP